MHYGFYIFKVTHSRFIKRYVCDYNDLTASKSLCAILKHGMQALQHLINAYTAHYDYRLTGSVTQKLVVLKMVESCTGRGWAALCGRPRKSWTGVGGFS